jgi:hypothetical protein
MVRSLFVIRSLERSQQTSSLHSEFDLGVGFRVDRPVVAAD